MAPGGFSDYGLPHRVPTSPIRPCSTSTVTARGATTSATRTPTGSQTGWSPLGDRAGTTGGRAWAQEAIQVEPWKKKSYCGVRPGHFDERPFADLDLADGDVDGDSLLDGEDDQDNDDYTNIKERVLRGPLRLGRQRRTRPGACGVPARSPLWTSVDVDVPVNAINPCVPNSSSRTLRGLRALE